MGRQSNGRGAQNALERRGRRGEMTRWRRVSDSIGLWLDFKPDVFAGGHHVGAPARCACVDDAQSVSAAFVGTWIGLRRDRWSVAYFALYLAVVVVQLNFVVRVLGA